MVFHSAPTTDTEVTIKQLREQLKEYEDKMELTAQGRVKEKERELERQYGEKERNLQDNQLSMAKKLGEAELKVSTLQSALEVAQSELFEFKRQYDETTTAKSDEMEIIMADLERANERASAAEREAERYKSQLASATQNLQQAQSMSSAPDMEQAIDILKCSSLQLELNAKEKEVAQLVEDVQRLQATITKLRDTTTAQVAKLETELEAKNRAFQLLEERLASQDDYNEIKRELNTLKSIEFSGSSLTTDSSDSASATVTDETRSAGATSTNRKGKSLEMLLLEKNRALQNENTQFKTSQAELNGASDVPASAPSPHAPSTASDTVLSSTRSSAVTSATSTATSAATATATPPSSSHAPSPLSRSPHTQSPLAHSPAPTQSPLSANTDIFASIIGKEIAASYQRHLVTPPVVCSNGVVMPPSSASAADGTPLPTTALLPNGHPSPSEQLMRSYRKAAASAAAAAANSSSSNNGSSGSRSEHSGSPLPHHRTTTHKPHSHKADSTVSVTLPPPQTHSGSTTPVSAASSALLSPSTSDVPYILDTAQVATKIREILSTHNIGQRLFAKHVLGLSQGTVSELLSKPKHWEKLTEKGRESYRKMHAWACDENNINTLKAIAPKKGATPVMSSYRHEDSHTEEKIAAILSEAQNAMQKKDLCEKSQMTNAMVANIYRQELVKMSNGGSQSHSDRKLMSSLDLMSIRNRRNMQTQENTEVFSKEMVARIYREELAKLAAAAQKSGNMAEHNMYQHELQRLASNAKESGSERKRQREDRAESPVKRIKSEPTGDGASSTTPRPASPQNCIDIKPLTNGDRDSATPSSRRPESSNGSVTPQLTGSCASPDEHRHNGSAFFLVRPRPPSTQSPASTTGFDNSSIAAAAAASMGYGAAAAAAGMLGSAGEGVSPLQRMQSIANSLMTSSNNKPSAALGFSNAGAAAVKPLRAVLPPITQEQFDKYAQVNTDELVHRVKETLSQYSISQRLFGEHILGLSQGSVSDLLARPKPWHMLTQKGREPFIRMKIFMDDQAAVLQLVSNQYHIEPDKLLRTNVPNCGSTKSNNNTTKVSSGSPDLSYPVPPSPIHSHASSQQTTPVPHHSNTPTPHPPHPHTPTTPTTPVDLKVPTPGMLPTGMILPPVGSNSPVTAPPPQHPMSAMEVASMSAGADIDTLAVTSKVKEILQFHNLGQKLFGEAVLGLSQGSVSELLSKPKAWHMLSLKGREPFLKMYLWLHDPHNIDRLRLWNSERKALKKQNRAVSDDRLSNDSNVSSNVSMSTTSAANNAQSSSKKARVFFSEEQKDMLKDAYAKDPYPNPATIEQLASRIGVMSKTVVNWFHNHRMRAKQQTNFSSSSSTSSGSDNGMSGNNIKCEPEDLSNHSDTPTTSDIPPLPNPAMLNPNFQPPPWMFPGFAEHLGFANVYHQHLLAQQQQQQQQQQRRGSNASADSTARMPRDVTVSPEQDQPEDLSTHPKSDAKDATPMPASKPTHTVNKRKCAKPQRAIEGVELDRSRYQAGHSKLDNGSDTEGNLVINTKEEAPDTTTGETPSPTDFDVISPKSERDDNANRLPPPSESEKCAKAADKIRKLQCGIQSNDAEWDDQEATPEVV